MASEEQLRIVEGVKVVDSIGRTELLSLDLLQVYEIDLLCAGRSTAVLDTLEGLLYRLAELAVEQRRRR